MTKRAIIHVENTEGVLEFARFLSGAGWTIISANKTEDLLHREKIPVSREQALVENNIYFTDTSKLVQSILNTKYPDSDNQPLNPSDRENDIYILCINFYPSMNPPVKPNNIQQIKAITKPGNYYISTLLRNAFVNYENILILTDPADYKEAIIQLRTNNITDNFRVYLAAKALNLLAAYDSGLSDTLLMEAHQKGDFLNYLLFPYRKHQALRSGLNPQQKACLYKFPFETGVMTGLQKLPAKDLSYGTISDASLVWEEICMMYGNLKNQSNVKSTNFDGYTFTTQFTPQTGTVFTVAVKYNQILGASFSSDILSSFQNTCQSKNYDVDNVTIGSSSVIDDNAANEMIKHPLAAIVAPGFTDKAKEIFEQNKSIKLISVSKVSNVEYSVKLLNGGVLFQTRDSTIFNHWSVKTKKRPAQYMADQMIFGMMLAIATKTHTAVLIKNFSIISIAQGCRSEKRAMEELLFELGEYTGTNQAYNKENPVADLLVCDTAFSLNDSVKKLIDMGVSAIIQTGGKPDDDELINYCGEHDVTLIFTGTSHISY